MFHTPRREQIIVSASRVSGDGPATTRSQVVERLFANGLEAARRGAAYPDLRITKPLAEESDNQGGTGAAGSGGAGQTAGQGQGQAGGKVAGGDTALTVEQVKTLVSLR